MNLVSTDLFADSPFPKVNWGSLVVERQEKTVDDSFEPLSVGQMGVTLQLESVARPKDPSGRKIVRRGDIVINSRSDRRGASGVSALEGAVSVVYSVMSPRTELLDPAYAGHLLKSRVFQDTFYLAGVGIVDDLWTTNFNRMSSIRVPLPPLETQRAIADYLDRETAEIDAMSADLDEMEALLTEHRNTVATAAIMRLEMDSANRRARLNVVADLISSNVDKKSRDGEEPVRLVNYTDVYYGDVLTADQDYMEATATEEQIQRVGVKDGDVIFTKDSESADDIGVPALIRAPDPDMVCGYHLTIARPRTDLVYPRFLYWIFMSGQAKAYWEQTANGVTRCSIGSSATSQLPVVLPPLAKQESVAAEIDRETSEIDAMLADIAELRDLLTERRAAVIAAAVTGQLDIPETKEATHV